VDSTTGTERTRETPDRRRRSLTSPSQSTVNGRSIADRPFVMSEAKGLACDSRTTTMLEIHA